MQKVITFGELLLRLSAPGHQRLFQEKHLDATFCGAEANVAVCLQQLGLDAAFVTTVPKNAVGDAAVADLRYYGVNVTHIVHSGDRLGTFYLEKGAAQRPSKVIYDRAHSAFSLAESSSYNWDEIFADAKWFHFTGITPALSKSVESACLEACTKAREKGLTISCDINFRSRLWSRSEACESMSRLMPYADVCIANEEDVEAVFGIRADGTDVSSGVINKEGYRDVARQLCTRFGCRKVAFTLRESISASDNRWSGVLYDAASDTAFFSSCSYLIHIVDRVGSGDSFAGGLIYALSNGFDCQKAVDFAVATSCLKHTIEGDYCRVTLEEVNNLLSSHANGRIVR